MELAFLNNQNAFAPYESVFEKPVTAGQDEYTIGTGGDIDLPRPISISWMKVLNGTTWHSMSQSTQENFAQYTTTNTGVIIPAYYYYEPTMPLGLIGFGTPLTRDETFKIAIRHEVTPFGMNDTIALPTGYYPLLLWGTVARIPNVPAQIEAKAMKNYADMLAVIKSQNTEAPRLRSNFGRNRKYDRHSDSNR